MSTRRVRFRVPPDGTEPGTAGGEGRALELWLAGGAPTLPEAYLAMAFLSLWCARLSRSLPSAAAGTSARSASTPFRSREISSREIVISCLRSASSRSSITWAKPASSGNSSADALPLRVWATRNISSSSSVLPGSVSAAIKYCSVRSRPSSDSATNAAITLSRSKSIVFAFFFPLNPLGPGGAVVRVENEFAAVTSAGLLRHDWNSGFFQQLKRGCHIARAQADRITILILKNRCTAKHFGRDVLHAAANPQKLFEQGSRRHIAEPEGRLTFPGGRQQEVIHSARSAPRIPETNGNAGSQDRLDLTRFRADMKLSRQQIRTLTFTRERARTHPGNPGRELRLEIDDSHCQICSDQARPSSV